MANPNIVAVTSIYGKTTYLTPSATSSVVLLPNAASSGTVMKINQIVASNVDGSNAVNVSVDIYTNGQWLKVLPHQAVQRTRLLRQSRFLLMPR